MLIPEIGKLYYGVNGCRLPETSILMLVNIEYAPRVVRAIPKPIKVGTNPDRWKKGFFIEAEPEWTPSDRFTKPAVDPQTLMRLTFLNLKTQAKEQVSLEAGPNWSYFFAEIESEEHLLMPRESNK